MIKVRNIMVSMVAVSLLLFLSCGTDRKEIKNRSEIIAKNSGDNPEAGEKGQLALQLTASAASSKATKVSATLTQILPGCKVSSVGEIFANATNTNEARSLSQCPDQKPWTKKFEFDFKGGKVIEIGGIPAGEFKLNLEFLAADNKVLEAGSGYAQIYPGRVNRARVSVYPVSGSGDLVISVRRGWECSDEPKAENMESFRGDVAKVNSDTATKSPDASVRYPNQPTVDCAEPIKPATVLLGGVQANGFIKGLQDAGVVDDTNLLGALNLNTGRVSCTEKGTPTKKDFTCSIKANGKDLALKDAVAKNLYTILAQFALGTSFTEAEPNGSTREQVSGSEYSVAGSVCTQPVVPNPQGKCTVLLE